MGSRGFPRIVCYYVTLISPQSYAMIREAPKQEKPWHNDAQFAEKGPCSGIT